jgi:sulfur relay (sulfurtransferase) DsrF/TusC family protein
VPNHTTWLVQLSSPPAESVMLGLGFDCILACGAFGQSVSVVLRDGAIALLDKNSDSLDVDRDISRELHTLPLYDIACLYIVDDDTNFCTVDIPEDLEIHCINHEQFHELLSNARHVLSF